MIKIFEYDKNGINDEIFSRAVQTTDVSGVVSKIIDNVIVNGDSALKEYALKFDGVQICDFKVSEEEINEAFSLVDAKLIETIKKATELGVDDYINKPFMPLAVKEIIHSIFND